MYLFNYLFILETKPERIQFHSTSVFSQGKLSEVSSQLVVLLDDTIQITNDVD